MTVMQSGSGATLKSGNGKVLLWRPLRGSTVVTTPPVTTSAGNPGAIPGVSGWWDAGTLTNLLDTSGNPVAAPGATVGSLKDISATSAALVPYHVSGTAPLVATARVSGLLGAVGAYQSFTGIGINLPAPVLDADTGLNAGIRALGSSTAWTVYLTWSRPNWRRNVYGLLTGPITLLRVGTYNVLQVDGQDGSGRFVLFPGTSQTVLSPVMERRHTHSVILRNTPGEGVDVWLDGSQIATGLTNALPAAYGSTTIFGHDTTANGSAQIYFHEAAFFTTALSSSYVANLLGYAARWTTGERMCVSVIWSGQSNAGDSIAYDLAPPLMVQGAAWCLGAIAWNVIGNYGSAGSATCVGSNGISQVPFHLGDPTCPGGCSGTSTTFALPGSFLNDPNDGSDPSGWSLGQDGTGFQSFISTPTTPAADLADVKAIVWYWSESDSSRAYSEKTYYSHAAYNLIAKERAMIPGATAANMPFIWWHPMPFMGDQGNQMCREVIAAMAADSSQNTWVGFPQTADSNPRGAVQNSDGTVPTYWPVGTSTRNGDGDHMDATDNIRLARQASLVLARAVKASSGSDTLTTIPSGIPAVGGPRITHAYLQNATTVILTVVHDAGTALVVPQQAANGAGFCVMDGGSVTSPGYLRYATACVAVDATHLQLTVPSITYAAAQCMLFYPYGSGWINRGNAVTDNYASLTPPTGWNIGGDLGSSWQMNFPLAATFVPLTLSASPT